MIDVPKLRRDYLAVSAWMLACGEWSAAESDEIGLAIKHALDDGDSGYLAFWADWLASMACIVVAVTGHEADLFRSALATERANRGLHAA
jgi:hypothetical protein